VVREFPTPPKGIPPTFAQQPLASGGKEGESGRGGRGKGRGRREGTPKGWLTPPCSKS